MISVTAINLSKWWLSIVLVIIPFQYIITKYIVFWNDKLIKFISYIDELTIIIFFPFAIRELYKNRKSLTRHYVILFFPLFILVIAGIISGIKNGNSFVVTSLGVFDYIKNFLVIFVYAAFFRDFREFKKVFRIALAVAVFMGGVALLQELWAVVFRYILQKDLHDSAMYILREPPLRISWRAGIYRTASLMYNPNLFGLYSILFLFIYINIAKRINFAIFIPLFTGIFVSASRTVYIGFVFMAVVQIFRGRRWFIPLVIIPIAVLLFSMSSLSEFDMKEGQKKGGFITYREYTRHKAIEVWKDYPFWGGGPGMFGGIISLKYNSYLYEEYNFEAYPLLKKITTFDQVWPQVLAEMGIIGTFAFISIFISLFVSFVSLKQRVASIEEKGLYEGLMLYIIVILIYTFASGLNLAPVLFTYCAFAGMGLGCQVQLRQ